MRVVSLVPSLTETLLAWGVEPVACTRFCEQPAIRAVGGTKNPDLAAIAGLTPDLVLMDEEENRREDHDALLAAGVDVHVTAVRSVADVDLQLRLLGERLGIDGSVAIPPGDRLPSRLAFVPIWRRPWMALGPDTYGASLLELLGVTVAPADQGRYPEVDLDGMGEVDVVLVPSEPYSFSDEHLGELRALGPTVRVDGQDLFWWGARTPGALERLRSHLAAR